MTAQPAVLQVVILRDGLLVGTEVFVPGSYTVGSGPEAEVKLDDASVDPLHAVLYFKNGRAAIQDNNSRGGVYVNGHRIRACEVRSQDEILCGPFVLKTRVVSKQAPQTRPAPSPEVAALLGGAPRPSPQPPPATAPQPLRPVAPQAAPAAPQRPAPSPANLVATVPGAAAAQRAASAAPPSVARPVSPVTARSPADAGTVVSARRAAALAAAPHLRPVEPASIETDLPTESIPVPDQLTEAFSETVTRPASGPHPVPAQVAKRAKVAGRSKAAAAAGPALPGKGAPRLYFELYWGDVRRDARSFGPIDPKKPLHGSASDTAAVPLWGFTVPEEQFQIAESNGEAYRLFVPPNAVVEKQGAGAQAFFPISPRELEADGKRRFLSLSNGMAARLSEGEMSLVAYVAPPPERVKVNPLKGLPWLLLSILFVMGGGAIAFLLFGPKPREMPDFTAKNLPPVAVKLIAPEPEKKKEAEKKLEKIKEKAKPVEKKEVAKAPTKKTPEPKPQPTAPAKAPVESKALKALAKLSAAGPATHDVLAAIDKMGSGPGSKNAKNNFKLSGLVGKDPIANAGLGTFGLGGGGKGGHGTKGLEVLYGKGAGGIGALGAGGFGKGGRVGGTVARASARQVAAQGSIDRNAVAKVINSHFQEVRSCYERALLKEPGLSGKAVLEWTISISGNVTTVRTKTSSLRNAAVESCILRAIKTWKFPPAKGGSVIITYPFLFNSVGY